MAADDGDDRNDDNDKAVIWGRRVGRTLGWIALAGLAFYLARSAGLI